MAILTAEEAQSKLNNRICAARSTSEHQQFIKNELCSISH